MGFATGKPHLGYQIRLHQNQVKQTPVKTHEKHVHIPFARPRHTYPNGIPHTIGFEF